MNFVNGSLIAGGLLIGIPIVLHLVMRQQPRQMIFPALRFLKQRRESNQRKLQLRHWILLGLRCVVIGLMALALARPSVVSAAMGNWVLVGLASLLFVVSAAVLTVAVLQKKSKAIMSGLGLTTAALFVLLAVALAGAFGKGKNVLLGSQETPVAAVLVIDTAPRMLYRQENKTRLEVARETAEWLLKQLPKDSEVAVLDSHPGPVAFAVDMAAAGKLIERLHTTSVPTSLVETLDRALELAVSSKKTRREVYVFTDLAKAAWESDSAAVLQRRLQESSDVQLHVFNVSAKQPQNFALGELQLSAQVLPKSGELVVQTDLAHVGSGGTRTVELLIEEPDSSRPVIQDRKPLLPVARPRGQELCKLPANGSQRIQFRVRGLELGVHQGFVRIVGEDSLPFDNQRNFTVEVKEAWPVLAVAPTNVVTKFFSEAIAPYEFRQSGQSRFACETISQASLANKDLADYAVVALLDPGPLTPAEWEKLTQFVSRGGGLAMFLGHNAQPATTFNNEDAQRLLGGKLARQWRSSTGDLFLSPRNLDHPITIAFRQLATSVPWDQFPVYLHWELESLATDTRLLMSYSNHKPAIVETSLGRGRVLTMTTPVSDPARPGGRQTWNELPTGDDAWPYFVLVNEMVMYLVSSGETKLNYLAGQTAVLNNDLERDPERYQLFSPDNDVQDTVAREGRLTVKFTEVPGAYRLKGFRGGPVIRGFSVNLPTAASDLAATTREELDQLLGATRYQFAANQSDLNRDIGEARVGREFYPYLVLALVLLLGLEQFMANRFYGKQT